jgi:hypothetical protein
MDHWTLGGRRLIMLTALLLTLAVDRAQAVTTREISDPNLDTDRAIVFVHGLLGDWKTTFTLPEVPKSWAEVMTGDVRPLPNGGSLAQFAVFSIDYHEIFGMNTITAESAAQMVQGQLEFLILNRRYNHLWIIAHSLGGVLVKEALIGWQSRQQTRFIDRVAGLFINVSAVARCTLGRATGAVSRPPWAAAGGAGLGRPIRR